MEAKRQMPGLSTGEEVNSNADLTSQFSGSFSATGNIGKAADSVRKVEKIVM
jgi:hypothetical protein